MSLGDTLRAAREQAGLSVDDIMNATQMTRDQVVGLETDDYHAFSAPVYTKGFIKLFARSVGLPAQPLVAEYLAHPNGTEKNQPDSEMPVVALETISSESGAIVSMRPAMPHAVPGPAPAPAEKKVSAAPAPAPAPVEKKAAAAEKTLLDFMEPASAARKTAEQPEKRLAPIEPGLVPPEPPSKLVRFDDPAPKPAPAPVAKSEPEPTAVGAVAATPYWNEVAPPVAPKPTSVPAAPFVFPGPAPRPAPAVAVVAAPVAAPAPVPAPAPAVAPAPVPAPRFEKRVSSVPDPRIESVRRPVLPVAAAPAFVEDDLFATPARSSAPVSEPEEPEPPAPSLFPDEEPEKKPRGPNPVRIFFVRLGTALGAGFGRLGTFFGRLCARVRAGLKARWVRPALLGVAGVVLVAALVGLAAALWPEGGEQPADPDAPVNEAFFPPEDDPMANGPVEIVPVLPAPRSFAK